MHICMACCVQHCKSLSIADTHRGILAMHVNAKSKFHCDDLHTNKKLTVLNHLLRLGEDPKVSTTCMKMHVRTTKHRFSRPLASLHKTLIPSASPLAS